MPVGTLPAPSPWPTMEVTCRGATPADGLLPLSAKGVLQPQDRLDLELRDRLEVPGVSSPGVTLNLHVTEVGE